MSGGTDNRRWFFKKFAFLSIALPLLYPRRLFPSGVLGLFKKNENSSLRGKVAIAAGTGLSRKAPETERYEASLSSLKKGIVALTGEGDIKRALLNLALPESIVGIKLNCVAAPNLSPSRPLVMAITKLLGDAGVKDNNIMIWERSERELLRGGFKINLSKEGVRCLATDSEGVGFDEEIETSGSIGTLFSRVVSNMCDVIVNVGVLKDHDLSGVCAGMKNFYGAIHNPNKYHGSNCDPYIADLCSHRFIRDKLTLTVIDASLCQYDGGPGFKPYSCVELDSLIIGFDMVSVDRVCHDIIEGERKKKGLKPLADENRAPRFIDTAEAKGLGVGNLSKIKVLRI